MRSRPAQSPDQALRALVILEGDLDARIAQLAGKYRNAAIKLSTLRTLTETTRYCDIPLAEINAVVEPVRPWTEARPEEPSFKQLLSEVDAAIAALKELLRKNGCNGDRKRSIYWEVGLAILLAALCAVGIDLLFHISGVSFSGIN